MRFAKLALSSLAVVAVAAFGVAALAQQPAPATPAPTTEVPVPAAEAPAPVAAPEAPPAEPAPLAPLPAVVEHAASEEHAAGEAHAAGGHELLEPKGGWKHDGYFGTFDTNALQRGFKVYKEVCSSCHGLKLLSFRNLGEVGGPFHDAAFPNPNDNPVVKKLASEFMITQVDPDSGDMVAMPGKPSDRFPSPYANPIAAAVANGGAAPPDLSVMSKARHGGAGYIYSLLQGYNAPPAGLVVNPGQNYNAYFAGDTGSQWVGHDPRNKPPGGFLAMASPLLNADVAFDDGTPTTKEQMAHDVALFLTWASDPKAEARKQMGTTVIPFLLLLAILSFLSYRRLWRNVEH